MKRSLILLGLSILTLLGVMVGQVYAGSRIDALFVFPNPAYIHDGNHVDFDWYPEEGVADRVSVRHRSSYEGSSNNRNPGARHKSRALCYWSSISIRMSRCWT
jgi:hypothetical protein